MKNYSVGIYCRLSKEDENKNDQSNSIQNQKELLTEYVLDKKWSIYNYYIDDGYTGTSFDRPGFKRMLDDIENGRINCVITKDYSRLGRDYIEAGHYLERYFPTHNIRYIAVGDNIDTYTEQGTDYSPFLAVINDRYAKDISNKVRATMNLKRKQGQFIGAFAPYGYKKDPNNKNKLIIDEKTAPVVERIYKLYFSGVGFSSIAEKLTKEGIMNPSTYKEQNSNYKNGNIKVWNHETVRNILTNPTYSGCLAQNKYSSISYKVKKLKTINKEDWVIVEDTHDPIISKKMFEDVQTLINSKKISSHGKKTEHLLKGLVYCKDCGKKMTFHNSHGRAWYFICSTHKRFKMCSRHSFKEEALNLIIIKQLKEIANSEIDDYDLLKEAELKRNKKNNLDDQITKCEKRLDDIQRIIKNLYMDKVKGILTEEDFINLNTDFNTERDQIKDQLDKLNNKILKRNDLNNDIKLLRFIKKIKNFESVDNITLCRLIDKIEIGEDKSIKVYYKFNLHLMNGI